MPEDPAALQKGIRDHRLFCLEALTRNTDSRGCLEAARGEPDQRRLCGILLHRCKLFRRLPKRGFSNFNFARRYEIVNVSQLDKFDDGSVVSAAELFGAGLVDSSKSKVKILGDGELTKKLEVSAHKFSKTAEDKIQSCGGTTKIVA